MNDLEQADMLQVLVNEIADTVSNAKREFAEKVNSVMTETYWTIGKYIVEFEQDGNVKAEYGSQLLTKLSHQLTLRLGKGYSRPNLNNMRKFYLCYPNCQTVSDKLTWSHICELIKIDDKLERSFYEKECYKEKWDVRTLRRQMDSALFLRLAASRDKEGALALAKEGITYNKPEDIVKDTYTLEFLGIPEQERYSEEDLEQKIIDNLQSFLLELGKGFTFVGRQYPLTINNIHYHVDLVFYHRILKCFVLIDLKKNSVQHADVGQMNMYMGYFAKEENMEDDNPPIGIILIKSGMKVAIVGKSGSGKSTLAKLLVGLYEPTNGNIYFDNVELKKWKKKVLRQQVGMVPQDITLFNNSIYDNIVMNRNNIGFEHVKKACELAQIRDEIEEMPMQYYTEISELGLNLSGGQRQRIALARAIVGKPKILLLDEATSSLDNINERKVSDEIKKIGATQIIIAHRLSTIMDADLIVVLEDGKIVEQGKHNDLIKNNGQYKELYSALV